MRYRLANAHSTAASGPTLLLHHNNKITTIVAMICLLYCHTIVVCICLTNNSSVNFNSIRYGNCTTENRTTYVLFHWIREKKNN